MSNKQQASAKCPQCKILKKCKQLGFCFSVVTTLCMFRHKKSWLRFWKLHGLAQHTHFFAQMLTANIVSWCSCLSNVRQGKGCHQIFVGASQDTWCLGSSNTAQDTSASRALKTGVIYNILLRPMVTWRCSAVIVDFRENMVHSSFGKHVSFSLTIL